MRIQGSVWLFASTSIMGCVAETGAGTSADAGVAADGYVVEAGPDAATGPRDAGVTCDPLGVFKLPIILQGFGTPAAEDIPRLSPDELTIYFRGGGGALTDAGETHFYTASRVTITDPFGPPMALATGGVSPGPLSPTSDGLTLFYATGAPRRLWFSTRASRLADFGYPAVVAGVGAPNPIEGDNAPFVTADGAELWFTSSRSGGLGGWDIYAAKSVGTTFANPVAQTTLSSASADDRPMLSADRLTVYLASDRPGTSGGTDIWRSHRVSALDAFPPAMLVPELSSAGGDEPGWLSPDNCRLYLTSTRAGTADIYVAERSP